MKKQGIFSGILFIGFGLYFLSEQLHVPFLRSFQSWPTLLMIVGLALLGQAHYAKEYQQIFAGTILFGFGLRFHFSQYIKGWPNNTGTLLLIIAIGMLLHSQKTKSGFVYGLFFLLLSCALLFYNRINQWFNFVESGVSVLWKFWPAGLIIVGTYLLFIKKR
jgi:putative Mn2+ efflux pump MntP